jgi:hypothetical protein
MPWIVSRGRLPDQSRRTLAGRFGTRLGNRYREDSRYAVPGAIVSLDLERATDDMVHMAGHAVGAGC